MMMILVGENKDRFFVVVVVDVDESFCSFGWKKSFF